MSNLSVKGAINVILYYDPNVYEAKKVIFKFAAVSAGVAFVGGCFPVLSIPATIIACFGTVWVMYSQICGKLGISFKGNALNIIARAAIANVAANLIGVFTAMAADMLIPEAAAFVSAVVSFMTVILAGLVFLELIGKMVVKNPDIHSFSDISEKEMNNTVKNTKISEENLNAAKIAYKIDPTL